MGTKMKPVHIDENGVVSEDTSEGIKAGLEMYDKMIAGGAAKEEAIKAADEVKTKMDKVCSNGYIFIEE